MTIETYQQAGAVALPSSGADAVGSIVQWAQNLSTAAQAIRLIVDTPFMPLSFWPLPKGMSLRDWPTPQLRHPRETEDEFVGRREIAIASGGIAVVKGDEVGLTPQVALESIYVVRGKPGMYAEAMEALVRSHGHQLLVEQLDDRICRMRTRRRGEDDWQRFDFSMERARKAGYTRQNPKYDSDPQTMLHSRCRSIASRGTAPEVLRGLRSVEEVLDEPGDDAPAPRTRTVKPAPERPQLAAPASHQQAPSAAAEAAQDESVDETPTGPEAMSDLLWRGINDELRELGIVGTGQAARRLAVIAHLVGHPVERGSQLTYVEGRLVYDTLRAGGGEQLLADVFGAAAPSPVVEAVDEPELPGQTATEYDPTTGDDWGTADDPEVEA